MKSFAAFKNSLLFLMVMITNGDKAYLNPNRGLYQDRAVSYHLTEAVVGEAPDYQIDFKKAIFSRGSYWYPGYSRYYV